MVAISSIDRSRGVESYGSPKEHGAFRLDGRLIAVIEDIARGVEEGDSGLKSCAAADRDASCGVSRSDASTMQRNAVLIEDEDECFDAIGTALADGFSFAEVAKMVQLGGGATHLLALERWCQLVRLECNADYQPARWNASPLHERRSRCRRTFQALRSEPGGNDAVAILHIVYGWPDPFLLTLTPDVRLALGREFAPLARYTDTVEAKRQELVHREAASTTRSKDVVPLVEYGARLRSADRCISSGDALRAAFAPPRPKTGSESNDEYRGNVTDPAKEARAAFLTAVRLDANRMLTAASLAYQDAWRRN